MATPHSIHNQATTQITCPICSTSARFSFTTKFAKVAKCDSFNCGHLFAINIEVGSGVQWVEDSDRAFENYAERDERLISRFIRDRALFEGARVLDYGAGTGHICSKMREILPTTSISCVEAHAASADRLESIGFNTFRSETSISGTFDFVLMVEVLEHLDDPVSTLRSLRRHMNAGATLFLSTPCGETKSGSRKTNAYDTAEHLHFFTERSLAQSLSSAGFHAAKLETFNEMYPCHRGPRKIISYVKDVLRPLRAKSFGHFHLTGYVNT